MGKKINWHSTSNGVKIEVPQEFDFTKNLAYLMRGSNEVMYDVVDGSIYRAERFEMGVGVISISMDDKWLRLVIENDYHLTKDDEGRLVEFGIVFFDLSNDLRPFYKFAANDELLTGLETEFEGLRLIGVPDFFEAIAWGILGQQITLSFAYQLKRRLVETYGEFISWKEKSYWLFPTPEKIASVKLEDLQSLQISIRKAEYLVGIAQGIVNGDLSKEHFLSFESENQIERELIKLRGIGPWTANYVMMRCFRINSAFPAADVGLLNAIKLRKGLSDKPTQIEMEIYREKWGKWCSYATFYLWRTLY